MSKIQWITHTFLLFVWIDFNILPLFFCFKSSLTPTFSRVPEKSRSMFGRGGVEKNTA